MPTTALYKNGAWVKANKATAASVLAFAEAETRARKGATAASTKLSALAHDLTAAGVNHKIVVAKTVPLKSKADAVLDSKFQDRIRHSFYKALQRFGVAEVSITDRHRFENAVKHLIKRLSTKPRDLEAVAQQEFEVAIHMFLIAPIGRNTPAHKASIWFAKSITESQSDKE